MLLTSALNIYIYIYIIKTKNQNKSMNNFKMLSLIMNEL
jgi:hypothetical protein